NVGIGTTSPSQKLDIAGNINLQDTNSTSTGVIYKDGVAFIHNFSHPTGDGAKPNGYNTFIGKNAGNFTMGKDANHSYEASYNTAIGVSSLYKNTIGFYDTAIGVNSLSNNTTGHHNTAQGALSLNVNTIGYYNTALGYATLWKNTTGHHNTAVGLDSLLFNIIGNYNTAVGAVSGHGIENSSNIVGNSLFGYSAGYSLQTGANYNTLLGYAAGDNIKTGAKNIIIGYNVDAPDENGSNQLNIGNVIYSDDMTTGKIGIGTPSPQANLHISSGTSGDATVIIEADTDNDEQPKTFFKTRWWYNRRSVWFSR
ncbi:MAG: hypothetical protein DSZ06_03035, partial [Sulfurospirillum sp.]